MPGLLADAGFIYQRKVILYHLLEAILNCELAECKIEIVIRISSDLTESFSLDFFLKKNTSGLIRFYEVKDQKSFYLKSKLRPVIKNFYQVYSQRNPSDCEFVIVHSAQIKVFLEKLYSTQEIKIEAIKQIIGNVSALEDFAGKVIMKQMIDDIDVNVQKSNIDLRSTAIIDSILKECTVSEYGCADSTYQALRVCYENLVQEKANFLKSRIQGTRSIRPLEEGVEISVEKLLTFSNSFIDKICSKFPNRSRNEIIRDFYTRFNLPQIPIQLVEI